MNAHLKYKANYFNEFQGTIISDVPTAIKKNCQLNIRKHEAKTITHPLQYNLLTNLYLTFTNKWIYNIM